LRSIIRQRNKTVINERLEVHQVFQELFPIITTTDMNRALGFYRDLLGFKVTYQFPEGSAPVYVGLHLGSSQLGIGARQDPVEAQSRFSKHAEGEARLWSAPC
jgi:catechol 2,3-dioxygenase-like lactoylglutathione lyase family enzyme